VIGRIDLDRLIFLDESGVSTQMTRLYAHCTAGARIHEATPDGRRKILTILGGVWMGVGITYDAIRTRGFRTALVSFDVPPDDL
jgi:hypothetical protein